MGAINTNYASQVNDLSDMASQDIQGSGGIAELAKDIQDLTNAIVELGKDLKELGDLFFGGKTDTSYTDPGSVKPPSVNTAPSAGYSTGTATSPTDTGVIGESNVTNTKGGAEVGTGVEKSTDKFEGGASTDDMMAYNDMDRIMGDNNLSLETKIFLILLKLQRKAREQVGKEFQDAYAKNKNAAGITDTAAKDKAKAEAQEALAKLQKDQEELNQLSQMTSNLQKLFHDMKMSTIGNIR